MLVSYYFLEELAKNGVDGCFLKWTKVYLKRKGRMCSQGEYSRDYGVRLGDPQEGVLGPTLFNGIMNINAEEKLPPGTRQIVYADEIVKGNYLCDIQSNGSYGLDM